LNTAKALDTRGVHIIITTLGVDLKTPAGRLVFGLMAHSRPPIVLHQEPLGYVCWFWCNKALPHQGACLPG
jgi:hypothetical protein